MNKDEMIYYEKVNYGKKDEYVIVNINEKLKKY